MSHPLRPGRSLEATLLLIAVAMTGIGVAFLTVADIVLPAFERVGTQLDSVGGQP